MRALMVGITVVDIAYMLERYPAEDTKATASAQVLAAGDPAANASVAFAALAGHATLLTALGGHPMASIARGDLGEHGVSIVDATPDARYPPPLSSVVVSRSELTRTVVSRDGADFSPRFSDQHAGLLDAADIVLFDSHHPELARRLAPLAHAQGIPIVLDVGRYRPAYDHLLPLATAAICSAAFRPPQVSGGADEILAYLAVIGVPHAAITNGAKPIRFRSGDAAPADMPVPEAEVVDTLAAGDTLHGAFCYYWLKTSGAFEDSLAKAAKVATESCRYFGPREWIARAELYR